MKHLPSSKREMKREADHQSFRREGAVFWAGMVGEGLRKVDGAINIYSALDNPKGEDQPVWTWLPVPWALKMQAKMLCKGSAENTSSNACSSIP